MVSIKAALTTAVPDRPAIRPTHIDLFAGCGGLSLGLHNAGWRGLLAIEKNTDAFETFKFNLIDRLDHFDWPAWLPVRNYDINYVTKKYSGQLKSLRGTVDLVTGGPPCQGFSMVGRREEGDGRNRLFNSYVRFVDLVRPKFVLFENVKGFTIGFKKRGNGTGEAYSARVTKRLVALGYDVEARLLDFGEFGVPQRRKRFILVGCIQGKAKDFFDRIVASRRNFVAAKGISVETTAKEAISDLLRANGSVPSPDSKSFMAGLYSKPKNGYQKALRRGVLSSSRPADSHRFAHHGKETINKFRYIVDELPGNKQVDHAVNVRYGSKKKVIARLDAEAKSPTLTTLPDDCIHYEEPRILTVREYARLQSFPDTFEFKGKYTTGNTQRKRDVPRYTQVGNAIPPLFAEQAGATILEMVTRG